MNADQLFKKAKNRASELPVLVKTPLLMATVMRAEIALFISDQECDPMCGYDGDRAKAILNTANDAINLIDDYLRNELL